MRKSALLLQGVSNVMWALKKMSHAPLYGAASAILEWFTRLCKLPGQKPNAQELSNTLFACAVLCSKEQGCVSIARVDGLLELDRARGYKQHYCKAAWSLAVSGRLSSEIFHALLERLQPLPTAGPAHDALPRQNCSSLRLRGSSSLLRGWRGGDPSTLRSYDEDTLRSLPSSSARAAELDL